MKVSFLMLRAMLLAALCVLPLADAMAAGKGGSSSKGKSSGPSQMKVMKAPTVTRTPTGGSFSAASKPKVMQFSPDGKAGITTKDLKVLKIQDRNPPRTETVQKQLDFSRTSKSIADSLKRESIKSDIVLSGPSKSIADSLSRDKISPDLVLSRPSKSIADSLTKKAEINPDLILSKPSKSIADAIGKKTQPGKPIDPGIGNGQPGKGSCTQQQWCNYRPRHCWWWFDYCHSLSFCQPNYCYPCNWNYVTCNYVNGSTVIENVKFYLGVQGMLLPGKGLGIETVEAGSPADLAGLKPGMVIVSANGLGLTTEDALTSAMTQSNGVLQLQVTADGAAQPVAATVQLQRMIVRSF